MANMTRREFFALGAKFAALMGLDAALIPQVAEALETLSSGGLPVLWLQGQSCSGCSVSLLNSEHPDPTELLTKYLALLFHATISAATGTVAMDVTNQVIEHGGYYLVIEGSIPADMPDACLIGGKLFTDLVLRAARQAEATIAVGACASFGGIPGAEKNPTGAQSVSAFFERHNLSIPVINIPGCPAHPDWIAGTLAHLLKFGLPELDQRQRPRMFYRRLMHDQCPRFSDYERERFAATFSDEGCLFKLGCLGPVTHADCALRFWNGGVNHCIKAGAPCIGCASETFASQTAFPFYTKHRSG